MKHFTNFLMLAAIAVASLASCARELDNPEKDNTAPEGYYMEEIFASYPAAETRTAFDGTTGKFSWSEGDEIAFHLSDGSYTVAEIDPATSKVKLYIREGLTRDNFAVYPASAAIQEHSTIGDMQVKLPDAYNVSDDPTTDYVPMPMVATQDETNHLKFNHTGALLQVNLDIPAGTKTAKVSLGDKALSGTLTVVADGDYYKTNATSVDQVSDGGNTITFTVSEEENGLAENTQAYLRLPVSTGTYDEIKIVYSDGEYDTYEFHKDVTLSFSRSAGKKLSIAYDSFEDNSDYFWIEALEANSTIFASMPSYNTNNSRNVEIYYSRDKKHWEQLFSQNNVYEDYESDNGIFVQLGEVGDRVYFRGKCDEFYTSTGPTGYIFGGTGKYATGGNPKSLYSFNCNIDTWDGMFESLFNSNFCPYIPVPGSNATFQSPLVDASQLVMPTELTKDCFQGMFESCKLLEHAPILHEVEFVPNYAYESMFHGCSSLKSVDFSIKATELGEYACYFMFGFSGLEEAPELDFLHTSKYCCSRMFENCKDLKEIPVFHNVDLSECCFQSMFQSCTSLTEITRAFPVTQLAKSCYSSMFKYCSGLQTVSEDLLPATVLADYCYDSMFGYSGLTVAPNLPATVLADHCYGNMFSGSKLTAAPELPATTLANSCYYSMFSGCKTLSSPVVLPATELTTQCYAYMFSNCTQFNTIYVSFTSWEPDPSATRGMISGKNTTACKYYKPASLETKKGADYIPTNWSVYNLEETYADI